MPFKETPKQHYLTDMWRFCESNYQLLIRLLPSELDCDMGGCIVASGLSIEVKLIEKSRYTTTIDLTSTIHNNKTQLKMVKWPVRLYHDAQLAEVLATSSGRQLDINLDYPNKYMHQTDEKYRLNEHLREWLQACVKAYPNGLPLNRPLMIE